MNRREFLAALTAAGTLCTTGFLITPAQAAADVLLGAPARDRTLWLHRPDTGESFVESYRVDGQIARKPYLRLCYAMRDDGEAEMKLMAPGLLDLLWLTQQAAWRLTGRQMPIDLLSAFRTRYHNAHVEGAAPNSEHPKGHAADIRMKGITPGAIAELALYFGMGGVGQYDTFTHVDIAGVRTWSGSRTARYRE
jgi:uncharacterized protein YcbK (DUF882 family)